ncbi:MAG: hydantoinase/oxoprolinase family protein [Bacteroidota bacterium]
MKLGIDIGGTFTDLVLLNEETGELQFGKTLTTYPDPTEGILNGVAQLQKEYRLEVNNLGSIVHGTTLVTNAVIERKGAKTGLITTAGFEDVLEIGRELRYDIYDIFLSVPEPLVPQKLRSGVEERLDKHGNVLVSLKENELEKVVEQLVGEGVESIAVSFLHSFANPEHEQIVGKFIEERFPNIYCSLSSEIMPEIREYERTSATAMNAYVQPITDDYLRKLESKLNVLGFDGIINIMISSGRLTTIEGARKTPIQLLESGPAGGTMAGVFFGRLTNKSDLLAFDMGGTTAKASLISNYQPEITNQFEAGRVRRFKKGSGLPVRIPVIDMIEIGAGGGSIARVNELGLLTVGPDSASSQPGPACYGRGGEHPTVTDADLVLGYLNEDYFLGGTMTLRKDLARKAIKEKIAQPLGISTEEAALGIHRIVNENMANAARVHILEKGLDPRHYSMIAFGGAGPVHAFGVARLLHSPQMIIPVGAGVTSALGFLVSPIASEAISSYVCRLEEMDWARVNSMLQKMEQQGLAFLERAGISAKDARIERIADMRYSGQGHEITINMPNGKLSKESIAEIERRFLEEYELRYSRSIEGIAMETVTWRVVVSGPTPEMKPQQSQMQAEGEAYKGTRQVYFAELGTTPIECPVYGRYELKPNEEFDGPAIIEEMESTTIIGANTTIRVDEFRNIIIELK